MDELEKIIVDNCADFEEEPKEGHLERFEERLLLKKPKPKGSHFSLFFKIAAIFVIILLSANLVVHLKISQKDNVEKQNTHNDLGEASIYYTSRINTGIRDLEKMAGDGIGSKQEIVQIKQELSEMDSLFANLQSEYKSNPNDERIINAMIEYYQTKLDIVNTIKTDLENVKQLKRKKHENPEI